MDQAQELPYWTPPHRPFPVDEVLKNDSNEFGSNVGEKILLFDIFRMLQRIESRMEGQDGRLETLEMSLRTTQTCPPTVEPESKCAEANTVTVVDKAKQKYQFQDSVSYFDLATDEESNAAESNTRRLSNHTFGFLAPERQDADTYSLSVYTDNPLSSHRLSAPNGEGSQFKELSGLPYEIMNEVSPPSPTTFHEVASRASSEESWKTAASGRSTSSHENAELVFDAYDNWRQGVLSKIKNKSRAENKAEIQRLQVLRAPGEPRTSRKLAAWKLLLSLLETLLQSRSSDMMIGQRMGTDKRVSLVC